MRKCCSPGNRSQGQKTRKADFSCGRKALATLSSKWRHENELLLKSMNAKTKKKTPLNIKRQTNCNNNRGMIMMITKHKKVSSAHTLHFELQSRSK